MRSRTAISAEGIQNGITLVGECRHAENVAWQGRTVYTGVWKYPVQGRRLVRRLNIDVTDKATWPGVAASNGPSSSIKSTLITIGSTSLAATFDGLSDHEVCIGDRYRMGQALFEVTQPRVTCYRVGIRMNEPQMPALLVAHGRPGFHFRVLDEGEVEAGDEIVRVGAGPEHT